ncbi:MAG: sensor histidine kinase [Lachnospiraceae bacterium]|nr:sensor histidine kinase [Lachnospiraceae bacterium]
MKKARDIFGSLFGRIFIPVLLGLVFISVTVSFTVLYMSRQVFTDTYGASQEKVFSRIEKELDDFHDDLQDMMTAIDSSWAFRLFLDSKEEMDNMDRFRNIYQMEADLEAAKSSDMESMNILVLGLNDRHYLSRTETISMTDDAIWESAPVRLAVDEPDVMHYQVSHGGYTATAKGRDVIIISKALYYQETGEIYAVVLITLTQDDMRRFYDYFITDYSSFYMTDKEGMVLCSDDRAAVGGKNEASWMSYISDREGDRFITEDGTNLTVLRRELTYQDCMIYGIIDNDKALGGLYNMPLLIFICVLISAIVLVLVLFLTSRAMLPLARLAGKMTKVQEGDFMEYMPVEGTSEVRNLAVTYNYMLDDIKSYIDELMNTQQEKRTAEIKALQMQINPHYIYNTLASIKWMVYAGDREKTIKMIDAFISLLRNTISNADEFITVKQEVENLNNYTLINQMRYGDTVRVAFHVEDECMDCLMPKMILQPFVENAFFHAFPSGRKGNINIYMEKTGENLAVSIADDGVGMKQDRADMELNRDTKKEHFSGIGMHNVRDRLSLLYGDEAEVLISSVENKGTTVSIRLPAMSSEHSDDNNAGTDGTEEGRNGL